MPDLFRGLQQTLHLFMQFMHRHSFQDYQFLPLSGFCIFFIRYCTHYPCVLLAVMLLATQLRQTRKILRALLSTLFFLSCSRLFTWIITSVDTCLGLGSMPTFYITHLVLWHCCDHLPLAIVHHHMPCWYILYMHESILFTCSLFVSLWF